MPREMMQITKVVEYLVDVETSPEMTNAEKIRLAQRELDQRTRWVRNSDRRFGFIIAFMCPVGILIGSFVQDFTGVFFNTLEQFLMTMIIAALAWLGGVRFGSAGHKAFLVGGLSRKND